VLQVVEVEAYAQSILHKRLVRLLLSADKATRAFLAACLAAKISSQFVIFILLVEIKRLYFLLSELLELSNIQGFFFSLGLEALEGQLRDV